MLIITRYDFVVKADHNCSSTTKIGSQFYSLLALKIRYSKKKKNNEKK